MHNIYKRLTIISLIILMSMSVVKIDSNAAVESDSAYQVIFVGESRQLTIKGEVIKATWWVTNKSVATVTNTGKITAKKTGRTTIKVSYKDKSYMQGKKNVKRSFRIRVENDLEKASNDITYEYYLEPKMETWQTSMMRCVLSNNSKVNIAINPRLEFYDEQDQKVSISESSYSRVNLCAGKTIIIDFPETDREYKYCKIVFKDLNNPYLSKIVDSKVSVVLEDKQNAIYLKTNNLSNNIVDIEVSTVFYKNDKLVKAIKTNSTLDINETTIQIADNLIPSQNIDYDTYKISYTATAK